ncbi:DUF6074 family protein [Rhizobium ruizarguesonis]
MTETCKLILFPLTARIGKIRHVAEKMLDKTSRREMDVYAGVVVHGMMFNFNRIGISEAEQDEQLGAFWVAVADEMARQLGRMPGSNESV